MTFNLHFGELHSDNSINDKNSWFENFYPKCYKVNIILISFNCFSEYRCKLLSPSRLYIGVRFYYIYRGRSHQHTSTTPNTPKNKIDWKGVHKFLKKLKTHKATGSNSIPALILKEAANLAPVSGVLFQLSSQIQTDWRKALVVPVFKKGDKHQASTNRAVLLHVNC